MTNDRELQARVLKALEFEPAVDAAALGVTAFEGLVTLCGSVKTYFEKTWAERTAAQVHGVRALANDIEVLPEYQRRLEDPAIAEIVANAIVVKPRVRPSDVKVQIENAFKRSAEIDAHNVQVTETLNGQITLTGTVRSLRERQAAEHAAWSVPGVTLVNDRLGVSL